MSKVSKSEPYRDRRSAEEVLNSNPYMKKEGKNKWRNTPSGYVRWVDSQNRIVTCWGK